MHKYLEVAAAKRRSKEWLGVRDVAMDGCQKYDMTNLPMKGVPNQSLEGIYSEHFVEHLFKYQTINHYYPFYVQRHNFAPKGSEHKSKREQCALGLLYQDGEHRYLWGKKEFIKACKDAGYVDVKEMPYNKSVLPAFNNIETPCRIREAHSAIVEAVRP
jgi:hypothetical protein